MNKKIVVYGSAVNFIAVVLSVCYNEIVLLLYKIQGG